MKQCGDCSECCNGTFRMRTSDQNGNRIITRAGLRCNKYNGITCTIYESRPDICRNFYCMYMREEDFPEWTKPNICGFIAAYQKYEDGTKYIDICDNRDGPEIDDVSLLWVINYYINNTNYNVHLNTKKHGHMCFENQ